MRSASRVLLEPLGEWRTKLIWRGFGVFINQLAVMVTFMLGGSPPPSVLVLHACGLSLVLFGPRLVLLVATAILHKTPFVTRDKMILRHFDDAVW